jgi:hypothetical protein
MASVGRTGVCASGRKASSVTATYRIGPSAAADADRIAQGAHRPADRTSLDHLISASDQRGGQLEARGLCRLRLKIIRNLLG